MVYNNETFKIGDWIDITIYDGLSCFAIITNIKNEKIHLYVKKVISFCTL